MKLKIVAGMTNHHSRRSCYYFLMWSFQLSGFNCGMNEGLVRAVSFTFISQVFELASLMTAISLMVGGVACFHCIQVLNKASGT